MTLPEMMILLLLSCRRVVLSGPAFRHNVKSQSTTASASPSVRHLPSCVNDANGHDGRQPSPVDIAINCVNDGEGGTVKEALMLTADMFLLPCMVTCRLYLRCVHVRWQSFSFA